MARRPTLLERQKVITAVIAMWFQLMQQYMLLLSKLVVAIAMLESNTRAEPIRLSLPLPREVYRIGFLHYATRTSDKMCVNMCRMKKRIFWKLCTLLREEGGLTGSHNMAVHEMVAIFLVTVGHNIKNRKAQFLFQRSAETISRTIKLVLLSILKLSPLLLEKPTPVPDDCTDFRWKHFKAKSKARTRTYKPWSAEEERAVIDVFTKLYEDGVIKEGSLNAAGFAEAERRLQFLIPSTGHTADTIRTKFRNYKLKFQAQLDLMNASGMGWDDNKGCCVCDKDIFAGWVKSHKGAAGLNNCRLPFWDELCKIFEVSRANGTEGMTPADAASRLEAELRATGSAPYPVDSYGADTTPMMEDLINQGYHYKKTLV
ncbi:hypothetical protein LINPERHAP1_LOCUS9674 [Linum perenne]